MTSPKPRTLFEKIWDRHVVTPQQAETPAMLYIDLHLVHEVTSPQAFDQLRERGLRVRRPNRTIATMDHSTPTTPRDVNGLIPVTDAMAAAQLKKLSDNCAEYGIPLYELGSANQGIVHVIGPEQGLTQPGMTIVCGDSHTSTHGAFGALAFGIGTSEVAHVLSSQCLLQYRPKTFEIHVDGQLQPGVTAKDIILAVIAQIGVFGGTGHVFEYTGEAIRGLSMEARMTICNMSIEGGARAGMIAPDDTTFEYLAGRPYAPQGEAWERAVADWRTPAHRRGRGLRPDAHPGRQQLSGQWSPTGPIPAWASPSTSACPIRPPSPTSASAIASKRRWTTWDCNLARPCSARKSMWSSWEAAPTRASRICAPPPTIMRGRRVADSVRMLVVPGSQHIKQQAEAEGLDEVFRAAGAEWREAGCSMCIAMNGDQLQPGQYAVSTSNRNFEGRQGKGGRTFLASPLTAAATAVTGHIADVRELL